MQVRRRGRGRHRPAARSGEPPGGEESVYLYGHHAIEAWIDARPQRIHTVYCESRTTDAARRLVERARAAGIAVHAAAPDQIAARAPGKRHQGLVAACAPFPHAALDDLLATGSRLLVVVDQLQDPHNLGAIMRSAEAVGAGGLIMPKDHCVDVTPVVETAAAGASAWLPVARVTNLVRAVDSLKAAGYWIAGLAARAEKDLFDFEPPSRTALVVGGEAGMRPLLGRQLDFAIGIPMRGHSESLNASVAAAVAMFVLFGRRDSDAEAADD